ncbi:MAG: hypothetical protein ACKO1V_12380, partial [Cyanobium sp.]
REGRGKKKGGKGGGGRRKKRERAGEATILAKGGQALHTGGWAYRRKVRPFFTSAFDFKGAEWLCLSRSALPNQFRDTTGLEALFLSSKAALCKCWGYR